MSSSCRLVLSCLLLVILSACAPREEGRPPAGAPVHEDDPILEPVTYWPHDHRAFTEGLVLDGRTLYESTGGYGQSVVQATHWPSGRILARHRLPNNRFGEGLTRIGHTLYQLTWKSGEGYIYEADTLRPIGHFHYDGEGWGLTHDDRSLIMSNGSDQLIFMDPKTFQVQRTLRVTDQGRPVDQLNELEYIDHRIWANLWHSDLIVVIDPDNGHITARLNGHALRQALARDGACDTRCTQAGVLNGIAYDPRQRRLMITGKNWPVLFETRVPDEISDPPKH